MDFSLTLEQEAFREELREFIKANLTPELEREVEREQYALGSLGRVFLKRVAEKGWLGIGWPKEYGGQGRGAIDQWIFLEEMAAHNLPAGDLTLTSIGPTIMRVGSEDQKRTYLPSILRVETIFAAGYTEPGAGSDLASAQTRAKRDGDTYVINGQKIYTSAAHYASHIWLLVRSDASAEKHRGLSILIVPLDTPGITVRPLWTMGGERTNEVFLEDVRVPRKSLVGEENRGWYYATMALDFERIIAHNRNRRHLNHLTRYAKQLVVDGHSLAEDAHVRLVLAKLAVEVEINRLLVMRNAWMIEHGLVPNVEASMAKIWGSELAERIADEALNIMGPEGLLSVEEQESPIEGRMERLYRGFPLDKFAGGTNEIQRNIIAQRGLSMPRG